MQLWTRMGQQQSQSRQLQQHLLQQALLQQTQPSQQQQQPPQQGLAGGIKPHYFSKQSPGLSAILSGKASTITTTTSSYPTPPPSPPMRSVSSSSSTPASAAPNPTEQQALLATLASQTLVKKLGSAFWDAFSGGSAGSPLANAGVGKREWDADKVRKVLEGKAVVRVVDVESLPSAAVSTSATAVID